MNLTDINHIPYEKMWGEVDRDINNTPGSVTKNQYCTSTLPQLVQTALKASSQGDYQVNAVPIKLPQSGVEHARQILSKLGITFKHSAQSTGEIRVNGTNYNAYTMSSLSWNEDNQLLDPKPKLPKTPTHEQRVDALMESFNTMRKEGTQTDLTLTIKTAANEDVKFPVHKALLCAASEHFNTMFTGPMLGDAEQTEIALECTQSEEIMEMFLNYLYTRNISKEWLADAGDHENALFRCLEMFSVASYFNLDSLKEECRPVLHEALNTETLIDIAWMASDTNDELLIDLCKWFVRTHREDVSTLDVSELPTAHLIELVRVIERIGAVSKDPAAHGLAETDSLQESICHQLENRLNDNVEESLEAFKLICAATIKWGNLEGDQHGVYKRMKRICRNWGRTHLEQSKSGKDLDNNKVKEQKEAFALFTTLMMTQRAPGKHAQ